MARAESGQTRMSNPLDLVEHIAGKHGWVMDRAGEDELTLTVSGQWTDYHMSLNWRGDLETLHMACAFDAKIPENRLSEVYRLVAQINEQLWLGHFDLSSEEMSPMYRHTVLLRGTSGIVAEQLEDLLETAIGECERFYPAFQFALWGGKKPHEAMEAAMLETVGEA